MNGPRPGMPAVAPRPLDAPRSASRKESARRRIRQRGQAMAEFAIISPLLLTLIGVTLDAARLFQARDVLESASRNAAEWVATDTTITTASAAQSKAQQIICLETKGIAGWNGNGASGTCTSPSVTTTLTVDAFAPGGSSAFPVGTAVVTSTLDFRMLFPYPFFTQNGAWTLRTTQTYAIIRGI